MRVALLGPVAWRTPPYHYGPWEQVTGLLAEGLAPWVVREIWYAGGPAPDHAVDITRHTERKIAAMRAHHTQTGHLDVETWVRDRLTTVADNAGLPPGRLAEAFTVLRTE